MLFPGPPATVVESAVRLVWLVLPWFACWLVFLAGCFRTWAHHRDGEKDESPWWPALLFAPMAGLALWVAMYWPVVNLAGALDAWLQR